MKKKSAHLTRLLVEGISNFTPFKGGRLSYVRDYDPSPMINVDHTTKMDIERAIKILHERDELSKQEIQMLNYVMSDGRLSRRDISHMIKEELGYSVDQRTISRRLDSAYWKISRFLGFEYGDGRVFKMVARQRGAPPPYILSDEDIEKAQTLMERV
jgi:hypothetical protein